MLNPYSLEAANDARREELISATQRTEQDPQKRRLGK
jgi:hypothetical protein